MGDYATLKAGITANIKQNDSQLITGAVLQGQLLAMVNALGAGYQYLGIATPDSPGEDQTPDIRCFYIAVTPGTYTHLGHVIVQDGEVAIIKFDTTWHKDTTGAAAAEKVAELGQYGENDQFARVVLDSNRRILYGVLSNGDFYFGGGCPQVVKDFVLQTKLDIMKMLDGKLDGVTVESDDLVIALLDKDGRIVWGVRGDGTIYPSTEQRAAIPEYAKLLDAMRDGCKIPFLLGSQLVQANVSQYDTDLGEHDTFNPEKLVRQFNYIGLDGKLPPLKRGVIQTITIGGETATILYMGTYVYAMTSEPNTVYRMPYSELLEVNEQNTEIEAFAVDCGEDMILEAVFETNDGNFIAQCYNGNSSSPDYNVRSLYKITIGTGTQTSASFLFKCVAPVSNVVGVREHWGYKQYGNLILVAPYGAGRTGQVWMSEDFGDSFVCIFNIADDTTYVATKPDGEGGYGAYGIHPLPADIIPPQGDDFWDNVSSIGNGSRHVHSLCFDEEFDRIWLVTGDDKHLVTGIYWSDDYGRTWHRKGLLWNYPDIDTGGTTQMLQVVSMKSCVLFGTDGWGNGLFRYNRGRKDEEPVIEFVFGWGPDHDGLKGIANHNIVTPEGVMLMVFAPNTPDALPRGGIVASDGYHFRRIFIDTYDDGVTLSSVKVGWTSFMAIHNGNLYIRTRTKDEIILVKNYNM